jgi:polyhydroxyalkanoate synthesis regulator phasin
MVVAHPGLDEHALGDGEGSRRIPAEQRVRGGRGARSEVNGHGAAHDTRERRRVLLAAEVAIHPTRPDAKRRIWSELPKLLPMQESSKKQTPEDATASAEGVGEALRAAVERTLAVTADSATETRQRAQGLLDDVVRRGQVAREQVTRRGEEAGARLAEAIGELRAADQEDLGALRARVAELEDRLERLESAQDDESKPKVEAEGSPQQRLEQTDPAG